MLLMVLAALVVRAATEDPHRWLEDLGCARALAWVDERNVETHAALVRHPSYAEITGEVRRARLGTKRLPRPWRHGDWLFDFRQDETNPRGVWRRTSVASFHRGRPAWETLLDLDRLARLENEPWTWGQAKCLGHRCLVALTRGGDAHVVREFDLETQTFVEDGFRLPAARGFFAWRSRDVIWVATDEGEDSLTASGFPRRVRAWTRGQPLDERAPLLEVAPDDFAAVILDLGGEDGPGEVFLERQIDFDHDETFQPTARGLRRVTKPRSARVVAALDGRPIIQLEEPWREIPAGAVLAVSRGRPPHVLFAPAPRQTVRAVATLGQGVLVNYLDDLRPRLRRLTRDGDRFRAREITVPNHGGLRLICSEDEDHVLVEFESFTEPPTLLSVDAREAPRASEIVAWLPPAFDAGKVTVERFEATSADGTRVPYAVVAPKGARRPPLVLSAYGAFGELRLPRYLALEGPTLLEHGIGVVFAHVRGGGELGPDWHQAARGRNRPRAYEDLVAVVDDLDVRRRAGKLAVVGESNAALNALVLATRRPARLSAVVAHVPLVDMERFHELHHGALWTSEYGDPRRPREREVIRSWSPYRHVPATGPFPETLLTSSVTDTVVHPGHARKAAARLREFNHLCLYFEDVEGGHAARFNAGARVRRDALEMTFLRTRLLTEADATPAPDSGSPAP